MAENKEVSLKDCVLLGFVFSIVTLIILSVFLITQGMFISGGNFLVLAFGLLIFILILTFIIFAPLIYVFRTVIIPKLKEI